MGGCDRCSTEEIRTCDGGKPTLPFRIRSFWFAHFDAANAAQAHTKYPSYLIKRPSINSTRPWKLVLVLPRYAPTGGAAWPR